MDLPTDLLTTALSLINAARESGLECRLLGSLAVFFYVDGQFADRPDPAKDIDLLARRETRAAMQAFLAKQSWILDQSLLMFAEMRETYQSMTEGHTLDLYYDEIDGNHTIQLKDRIGQSFSSAFLDRFGSNQAPTSKTEATRFLGHLRFVKYGQSTD